MIESSRLFLFTEYARKGCGTIETRGTNYKVWDALPVGFYAILISSALLIICRIAFLQTSEPRSCLLESRTTSLLKSKDSHLTTLGASPMARIPVIRKVFIQRN